MVYIYKKHMRILIVIYLYALYMYAKSKNDTTLKRNALVNTLESIHQLLISKFEMSILLLKIFVFLTLTKI